jgi:biopolymer transport protein ExbD
MRLARRHPPRPQIPTTPMANLAMLVLTSVMIAGMLAASRGPALRFASSTTGGGFDDRGAVRVEVDADNHLSVDGEPVADDGLAASVTARLAGRPDGAVVLAVSPDASYQAMIDAYAAIAALPGPPRIALPSRPRRVNG